MTVPARQSQKKSNVLLMLLHCIACVMLLTGCGGTESESSLAEVSAADGTTLLLSLVRTSDSVQITTISSIEPGTLIAKLTDASGNPIEGLLVTFATSFAVLNPSSGTALTDAAGEARIQLLPGSIAGAGEVSAQVSVNSTSLSVTLPYGVLASAATAGGSLNAVLTDSSGIATSSIRADSPGTLTVTLTDANSNGVSGVIVTFATDLASLNPANGTTLTDSTGQVTVALIAGDKTGADTVKITADVASNKLETNFNYQVNPPAIQIGNGSGASFVNAVLSIGVSPLSAGATTGVVANIVDQNGNTFNTPIDINFTSSCVAAGESKIDATVTTVNGQASATYKAEGCVGLDTITATANFGGTTFAAEGVITVSSDVLGSIEFISTSQSTIVLKGTGGAGRSETSIVTFKVKGSQGLPIANQLVDFSLNTEIGGLQVIPTTGLSNSDGEVSTVVQAGNVASSVRVTASVTLASDIIAAQSDQLAVGTGLPDQDSVSLSVSALNPEAADFDGEIVVVTMRLADHFNNPVPDGTSVSFITEGGAIEPSCETVKGACSVNWISQKPLPADHRVTILATAIGTENFRDNDGNGFFSTGDDFTTSHNLTSHVLTPDDLPEAFLDSDESGSRDINELFLDFDNNGQYDTGNDQYDGIICSTDSNRCVLDSKVHVRDSIEIVMSGSIAKLVDNTVIPSIPFVGPIDVTGGKTVKLAITITDEASQTMPKGTIVSVTAPFLAPYEITGDIDKIISSTTVAETLNLTIKDTNTNNDGVTEFLTIEIVTPKDVKSTFTLIVMS